MKVPFVDLKAQYNTIKKEIDQAIAHVINDSSFIGGKHVKEFENNFAEFLGINYCIGCANGTDSIEILLKAFGIGEGDEVIVPAISWISTSEAVSSVNATPVFVDIHPEFYTIDASKIESKITSQTKAIIPVHLYGLPAEMDAIMEIAKRRNLIVIEDCAQSHGALYKGKKAGTIGHAASFSFYPGKNLGAYGDAGCMVTPSQDIAEKCRAIANHGQLEKHNHIMEGRNSRLDALQAAILNAKLPYLEQWTEQRISNAAEYNRLLRNVGIELPSCPSESRHVYHLYVIRTDNRQNKMDSLKSNGVETAIHYPTPLPLLKAYSRFELKSENYPMAHKYSSQILSLPMYPELSKNAINYICKNLH